ncbi:MAG: hypothetical protein ACD_40C00287G0005 [uncultured bacterium]|uniref:Uncharacterized protein n=1 Tax=Candidatus Collierbacteria bacterium RIFOXYA2_FULL_46_10 TaxID=1817726 RepID=A0A1F5F4Q2_9BACT|nr:MAG: hypothetical protein ACD_40C00287G0005 [uncultured bacterium]KKU19867.1 MAG: hypothetical protein UX32_C0032G0007 [Microgenomates group bacterium GW2011_GWF1_46_12]KKU25468.1 MAG: hypothetical protein UX38_C0025G0002 [Microgenomates group bacterium GW2011_GWC1_46_16]KKU26953.1 MAG: hypothetical protein UX40_C0024G0002 [Microgenomates group bacterium GW2011_GWF2_46_18]KKU44721.1 MAG: hypothetical protein UX63_C0024G0011 [Microgenomates group bacterium GW2011_GWB1_46_7]KKU60060.1 MAG: hy
MSLQERYDENRLLGGLALVGSVIFVPGSLCYEIYQLSVASNLKEIGLAIAVPLVIALTSYKALTTLMDEHAQILTIDERNRVEDPSDIYR